MKLMKGILILIGTVAQACFIISLLTGWYKYTPELMLIQAAVCYSLAANMTSDK